MSKFGLVEGRSNSCDQWPFAMRSVTLTVVVATLVNMLRCWYFLRCMSGALFVLLVAYKTFHSVEKIWSL
jgi:hypothetical protein